MPSRQRIRAKRLREKRRRAQREREAIDSEDDETPEDISEYLEKVKMLCSRFKYSESKRCDDGMPGFLVKKKLPPTDHRCWTCREKFCIECDECPAAPAMLKCICPPMLCIKCMRTHVHKMGRHCADPYCSALHFACPSCKKENRGT